MVINRKKRIRGLEREIVALRTEKNKLYDYAEHLLTTNRLLSRDIAELKEERTHLLEELENSAARYADITLEVFELKRNEAELLLTLQARREVETNDDRTDDRG